MGCELEVLLSMDGEIFHLDGGFWTKFEVRKVEPTGSIPHGVRYSLTLHAANNQRVFGIDNAHAPKLRRKKYAAKKTTWDHKHQMDKVKNYEFDSPEKLLKDFWMEVDQILKR